MRVAGKVDSSSYQEFSAAVNKSIADGTKHILLDFSACDYMSSAGIRALNEIYRLLRKKFPSEVLATGSHSVHVKLLNPSEKIIDVLKISGVDAFFEIHNDLETAVASF